MRFKKTILACGITLLALLSARPARADTSAVAVLSSDKRTLTFVNPKDKTGTYAVSQDGTKYNGTVLSASGAAKDDYMAGDDNRGFKEAKSTVTKIVIKDALAPDDASYYFADFKKLESVEGLDKLTLPEKAAGLFYNDTALATVDMSKTDASKTTDISYMFSRNSIGDDAETLKLPDSDALTAVKLPSFKSVTNAKYAFWSAKSIKSLDVSGLNPDATGLTHAFGQMSDVTDITLPDKFANKADDLSYLFYKDTSLSTLDGDKLDLSNATSARYMIAGAGLTTLNMAKWHMSNMTNLEGFARGSKLTAVDLSNAGITSVNLSSAFAGMDNLAGLNLAGIKKATNVESLAANDTKLTSVNVPFDTSSVTDFSYAFQNVGLEELDLSSWNTTNAKSMKMMFTSSSDLSKVTLGSKFKFNNATLPNAKTGDGFTGKWTKETDYSKQTSNNCYSADDLAKLSDVSGTWVWSGKDTRTEFFVVVSGSAANLIKVYRSKGYKNGSGDFEDVDGNKYSGTGYKAVLDGTAPGWTNNSNIKTFNVKYKFKPAGHFDYMFYKLSNLTTINGMEKLDFTNTTTASHMFDGSGMKSLDLTVFDDTNTPMRDLKDVSYFLANMPNLTSVTFAKGDDNPRQEFYTRNATNFSHLFENDTAITSLGFGYWNKEDIGMYVNNATDTSYMFAGMTNLRSISGFQLSASYFGNVRNAESMFDGTVNLTDLGSYGYGTDRPEASFAFYHLQNARHMFRNTGLSSLKMQFFHFKNTLTDATGMFDGSKITQLIIGSNNAFNGHGSFQDMSKVDDAYTNRWVRDGKAYTVDEISRLDDLTGTWTPEADSGSESDKTDTSGNQYAVKAGSKVYFIRSTEGPKNGTIKDIEGNSYTGDVYSDFSKKQWKSNDVSSIIFKQKIIAPSDLSNWFSDMTNLKVVKNANLLDTSNVTNMRSLFINDVNLASIDVSKWDVVKVVDFGNMFHHCYSLNHVGDLSNWNVSNATNMSCMFRYCTALTSVGDLSKWNVSKVQNLECLFANCISLISVGDLSKWDLSSCKTIDYMFWDNNSLTSVGDLSKWDVSHVTSMVGVFFDTSQLTSVGDLSNWNTSNVTDMRELFHSVSLKNVGNIGKWDVSHVTSMDYMFCDSGSLTYIGDLSKWNVSHVTSMAFMFRNDGNLTYIGDLSKWGVSRVTSMRGMFSGCGQLTTLGDLNKWDVSRVTDMTGMFQNCGQLTTLGDLSKWDVSRVSDMEWMFQNCGQLTTLGDLSKWDVSRVTDMEWMFQNCGHLATIGPLTDWNTSSVTSTREMFQGDSSLTSLDLSKWDMSHNGNMYYMFDGCSNLTSLGDLSHWNVSSTGSTAWMFSDCQKLTGVKASSWNLSNVGYVDGMFYNCRAMTSSDVSGITIGSKNQTLQGTFAKMVNVDTLDVSKIDTTNVTSLNETFYVDSDDNPKLTKIIGMSKWNTSNVTSMVGMFYYQRHLTAANLSSFDTRKVTDFSRMFEGSGFEKLNLSNFKGPEVTSTAYMFKGMPNIKSVDLSSLDTPKLTNAAEMFAAYEANNTVHDTLETVIIPKLNVKNADVRNFFKSHTKISTITLGPNWVFKKDGSSWANKLNDVPTSGSYDGTWNDKYTSSELAENWTSSMADTYTWTDFSGNNSHVYAVIDKDGTTMSFIRSNDTVSLGQANTKLTATNGLDYTGWVYDANGGWINRLPSEAYDKIRTVKFLTKVKPTSTAYWFNGDRGFNGLVRVTGAQRLDMSEVTDASYMFYHDRNLTSVGDLSGWQTGNIRDTSYMFTWADKLTSMGDLGSWDMSNNTNMNFMFGDMRNLVTLGDLSKWNTSKVKDMSWMFADDGKLTTVGNLDNWNVGNVTDMTGMFIWCGALTNVGNLDNWNVSNVTGMRSMFESTDLTTVGDLSKWQTGKVQDTSEMFSYDKKLTSVGNLDNWDMSSNTNMTEMFRLCSDLTNVGNLDNWNVSNVTGMSYMFKGCYELTNVGDLSKWQTGKVKDTSWMFESDNKLTKVGNLDNWDMSSNTNMAGMFNWCRKLTSVGNLDNWNVSNVTDMGSMFNSCYELTNVGDLSKWQTGKVEDTSWMFESDKKLTKVGNLDNWDMSSNTNMAGMFDWCNNLITIGDLFKWDVSNVTDMHNMFNECYGLTDLGDLDNWQVGKVTNMATMFGFCGDDHFPGEYGLKNIGDLSKWDVSNVTNMHNMFASDASLTDIGNLKNWDVRKVTDMSGTFSDMTLLKSLDMSNWSTDSLKDDGGMLDAMYRLESISFGPKTRIDADAHLNDPTAYGDATWGKWVRTSDNKALSGYDLSAMGATSRPTTWVAKRMSLTVKMRAEDKGGDYYDETLESFDINSSGDSGVVDKAHLTDRINFFTKHAYDMTENNVPDNFDYDAESWHMTYTVDFDRVKSQISMALNNMPGVTPSYVTNFLNGSTDSYNNRSIRAAYGKNSFELNILYKVGSDNLFDNFKYDSSTGTFALNRYGNGTTSYNPLVKSAFIFDKIPYAFKITKMLVQDKLSPSATITGGRYSYSNMSHYAGVAVDNINPGDNVVITIDFETSLSDIINYSETNNNMITPYFGPSEKDAVGEHAIDMHVEGSWGERYDDLQIKNPDVYMLTPMAVLVDSDRNETMYYKTKSIFNTWGDKPKDATVNIPNYHWDSTVDGYDNMANGATSLDWNGSNGMHASRIEYDNGLNWGLLNKKDSHYDSAYENVALQSLQTNNDFNSAYTFINMDHNNYEHLQSLNGNIGKLLDNKQNTSISYEIQAPKTVADQANTVSQTNKFVSIPYATLNVFAQSLDFYHEPIYSYKDWINTALDNPLNQSFKGQVYLINSDENLSEYNNPSAYATKIPNHQESHTSNGGTNWQMDGYRGSVDAINVDIYYGLLSNMDASSGKYVLSAKAGYGISYPFQYTILDYMSHVMTTKAAKLQAQTSNLFDDLYIKDANNEELTTNYKSTIPAISSKISTGLLSPSLTAMVNKIKAVDKTVTHYGYGDTNADYQALNESEQKDVDYLINYMSTLSGINSMYPAWAQASFEPQAKVFKNGHQVYANETNGTNGFNRSYIKSDLPQGIYPIRLYGNYGDVEIDVNDWEVKLIGKRLLTKGGDNKNDEISVEGALSGDSTDDVSRLKSRYHLTQDQAEKLHDFLMDNDK